jgi:hypothetical protein
MLTLENQDIPPTLIRTGDDVQVVRDARSSISRAWSGNVHRLRIKSRDEQEPSMSHLGISTTSPSLRDIEPGRSAGSMDGVSPARDSSSLTTGDMSLLSHHLDLSSPGSTRRLSSSCREGSTSTRRSSLPASLGSREPPSRGTIGRSQSSHIQPPEVSTTTRGIRRYHSSTTSASAGGTYTPRSRRLGVKPSKHKDGIMKPIEKSNSGLASLLFGGGSTTTTNKKSKSKKKEPPSLLGAGLLHARKKEH